MEAKVFWKSKEAMTHKSYRPSGLGQGKQRTYMTTGAILGAVLLVGAMVAPLCAQSYPGKPIRLIMPFPVGGTTDIVGRIIGQKLSERLGQPVVPENRPGAGGNLGTEVAAKARPDGHTIVLVSSALCTSPSLYKKINYDPIKDLAPISLAAQSHYVVLVRSSLPVKNLQEFAGYAMANPGKLNFTSGGVGTSTHLAGEMIKSLAKINIVHVTYKGAAAALTGLMGGEVDMMVSGTPSAMPQIKAGTVRALAVLGERRLPALPNVPTAKEAGMDNLVVTGWYGILAPAGTPRDIVNRLNAEWIRIAAMPDTIETMKKAQFEPLSGTSEQFSEFLKAETVRWARIIGEAKIASLD